MENKAPGKKEDFRLYLYPLLGILIMIAALIILGIKNPGHISPDRCVLQFGLNCKSHAIDYVSSSVSLTLQNEMGEGIAITEISIIGDNFDGCSINTSHYPLNRISKEKVAWHIPNDKEGDVIVHCRKIIPSDSKIHGTIFIKWSIDDANDLFTHTIRGELLAPAHAGEESCCCNLRPMGAGYSAWIERRDCTNAGLSCTGGNFHSCPVMQDECCNDNNLVFWGGYNCSFGLAEKIPEEICMR
ncbi:hypothetical protein J4227_03250 [Candidatus Woesearchaeota archaeon]|nr:hypothetical protein [Candidatus Woesearchaeota archaeon]